MPNPSTPSGNQVLESIIIRKGMRIYLGVWLLLVIAAVIEAYTDGPAKNLPSAIAMALLGLAFAVLFLLVAKKVRDTAIRRTLLVILGYHALIGPVFLLYAITTDTTRNSDLPLRMYPHIVEALNSLE